MEERIQTYVRKIDDLLAEAPKGTDWEQEREEHLIQLSFFQHERLIHLIVTVTFAVLTILVFLHLASDFSVGMALLLLLLLSLLLPYIRHYYILENNVQKMYRQYDILSAKVQNKS